MITEIHSQEEFNTEIASHKGYSLIDFWATWCGPCRMMAPVMENAEKVLGDKIHFCKVDVDEQAELARRFGIMSIPTLIVMKDGKVVEQAVGARGKADIAAMLERHL